MIEPHKRVKSIDFLRGLVMILMPLDHVRDFLSNSIYSPFDIAHTTPSLFFTRVVVNFCAPVFIFLAGTSMFLWKSTGKDTKTVSFFLFTRGLLLILFELTIIRIVWAFNFDLAFQLCQIFWAIGWCMIFLSGIIFLPYWLIATLGGIIVAFTDFLSKIAPTAWGAFSGLYKILHGPGETQIHLFYNKVTLQIEDPLLPWIGVMALGYVFGKLYTFETAKRIKGLLIIGFSSIVAFVVLRYINVYRNPDVWHTQKNLIFTIMDFIKSQKYPASLDYLLFYLGFSVLLLAAFEKAQGKIAEFFITYGKVPLAYYVVHVFLIHTITVILALFTYGTASFLFSNHCLIGGIGADFPKGYGYSVPILYVIWIFAVLSLYPFCKWYRSIKEKYRNIKIFKYI
jgi:uncharacterized membrane protein